MSEETSDERWERLSQDRIDRPLPKRFYKQATVGQNNEILLDGRAVKTPQKAPFVLPNFALAHAVAAEWQAQVTHINPATMPLTKLANTAIDRVSIERAHIKNEMVQFAGNDLVCYRADRPPDLVAMQKSAWDPVLNWALINLDARFKTTIGVIHIPQEQEALNTIAQHFNALDNHTLCATHNVMTLTGSALIALMVQKKVIAPEQAWAAACIDEAYQASQWGEDFEAAARRKYREQEFNASALFLDLLVTT